MVKLVSHNISSPRRNKTLPPTARVRQPHEQRSVSRSAARALDLLEYIGHARRPLRAKEIADALGMHGSTALQMLKTLVDAGHLLFEGGAKVYLPSHRLANFGAWLDDGYWQDRRLTTLMEGLRDRVGLYVALFAQNDISTQIIDARWPDGSDAPAVIGTRMPLFGSASGAALLSSWDENEIRRWMARARLPADDWSEMLAGVALARQDGHAFGGISPDNSTRGMAMILPPAPIGARLVIGLSGEATKMEADRAVIVASMADAIAEAWR